MKEMKEDFQEHQKSDKEFFSLFSDELKETRKDIKELREDMKPVIEAFNGMKFSGRTAKIILATVATVVAIIVAIKSIWN